MAEPLTWKNVSAPDFSGAANMLKTSSDLLSKGTKGLSDGLSGWNDARMSRAEMQLAQAAMGYDDPSLLDQDLRSGRLTQNIDPSLLNNELLTKAQGKITSLQTTTDARKAADLVKANHAVGLLGAQLEEANRVGNVDLADSLRGQIETYAPLIGGQVTSSLNKDRATQETKLNAKSWQASGKTLANSQVGPYDAKVLEKVTSAAEALPEYQRDAYYAEISKALGYEVNPLLIDPAVKGAAQSQLAAFDESERQGEAEILLAAAQGLPPPGSQEASLPTVPPEEIAKLTAASEAAKKKVPTKVQEVLGAVLSPIDVGARILDNTGRATANWLFGGNREMRESWGDESSRLNAEAGESERRLRAAVSQNETAATEAAKPVEQKKPFSTKADGANSIVGGINFTTEDGRPLTQMTAQEFSDKAGAINAASKLNPTLNSLSGGKGSSASGGFQFQPGVLSNIIKQNPGVFPKGMSTVLSAVNQEKAAKALYDQLQKRGVSMIDQGWQSLGNTPELRAKYGGNNKNRPPWSVARKDILDGEAIGGSKAFDRDLASEARPQDAYKPSNVAQSAAQVASAVKQVDALITRSGTTNKVNNANADATAGQRYYEAAVAPGSDDLTASVASMGPGYENASVTVQNLAEYNQIPYGVAAKIVSESLANAGLLSSITNNTLGPGNSFILKEDAVKRKISQYKEYNPGGSVARAVTKAADAENTENIAAIQAEVKKAGDVVKAEMYKNRSGASNPAALRLAQYNLQTQLDKLQGAVNKRN